MIKTEQITINGQALTRTYSTANMAIARDGVVYAEAIDPANSGREYTETDTPLPAEDVPQEGAADGRAM